MKETENSLEKYKRLLSRYYERHWLWFNGKGQGTTKQRDLLILKLVDATRELEPFDLKRLHALYQWERDSRTHQTRKKAGRELADFEKRLAAFVKKNPNDVHSIIYRLDQSPKSTGLLAREVLKELKKSRHFDLSGFADQLCYLAVRHNGAKQYAQAIPLYRYALDIMEELLPPDHIYIYSLNLQHAAGLSHIKKFDAAGDILKKAMKQVHVSPAYKGLRQNYLMWLDHWGVKP